MLEIIAQSYSRAHPSDWVKPPILPQPSGELSLQKLSAVQIMLCFSGGAIEAVNVPDHCRGLD